MKDIKAINEVPEHIIQLLLNHKQPSNTKYDPENAEEVYKYLEKNFKIVQQEYLKVLKNNKQDIKCFEDFNKYGVVYRRDLPQSTDEISIKLSINPYQLLKAYQKEIHFNANLFVGFVVWKKTGHALIGLDKTISVKKIINKKLSTKELESFKNNITQKIHMLLFEETQDFPHIEEDLKVQVHFEKI